MSNLRQPQAQASLSFQKSKRISSGIGFIVAAFGIAALIAIVAIGIITYLPMIAFFGLAAIGVGYGVYKLSHRIMSAAQNVRTKNIIPESARFRELPPKDKQDEERVMTRKVYIKPNMAEGKAKWENLPSITKERIKKEARDLVLEEDKVLNIKNLKNFLNKSEFQGENESIKLFMLDSMIQYTKNLPVPIVGNENIRERILIILNTVKNEFLIEGYLNNGKNRQDICLELGLMGDGRNGNAKASIQPKLNDDVLSALLNGLSSGEQLDVLEWMFFQIKENKELLYLPDPFTQFRMYLFGGTPSFSNLQIGHIKLLQQYYQTVLNSACVKQDENIQQKAAVSELLKYGKRYSSATVSSPAFLI